MRPNFAKRSLVCGVTRREFGKNGLYVWVCGTRGSPGSSSDKSGRLKNSEFLLKRLYHPQGVRFMME